MGLIRQDSSHVLQEWAGLVKLSAGAGGTERSAAGMRSVRIPLGWSLRESRWSYAESVKRSAGAGGIGESFCGSGWDLVRLSRLVKRSAGVSRIFQNSFGNRQDLPKFVQEKGGVIRIPFCRSKWDLSGFLQEWMELVKFFILFFPEICSGMDRSGQTFCRSGCDWSKFL